MNKINVPNNLKYKKSNVFSWCNDAFIKAKNENKPIILSIGYS